MTNINDELSELRKNEEFNLLLEAELLAINYFGLCDTYQPAEEFDSWYLVVEEGFRNDHDDFVLTPVQLDAFKAIENNLTAQMNENHAFRNDLFELEKLMRTHPMADLIRITQRVEEKLNIEGVNGWASTHSGFDSGLLVDLGFNNDFIGDVVKSISALHSVVYEFVSSAESKARVAMICIKNSEVAAPMDDEYVNNQFLDGDKRLALMLERVENWKVLSASID